MPEVRPRSLKRRKTPVKPHTRQIVAALLLTLAIAVQYRLSTLPVAVDLAGPLSSPVGAELILSNVAGGGALLAYSGSPNESADIRFDRARLAPESVALLHAVGLDVTDTPGAVSWIARAKTASRTVVDVRTSDTPVELRMRALPGVGVSHPQIELAVHGSSLQVLIATPFVPGASGAQAPKILNVAGRNFELPGAIPLKILVPDGATWRARFSHATEARAADFVLGTIPVLPSERSGVKAQSVGVRASAAPSERYDYFACAAPLGAISWSGAAVLGHGQCNDGGQFITASRLRVHGAGLELDLEGSGWAQQNGEELGPDLLRRIVGNPVMAGVLLAVNLSLLAWLLLEVFGARLRRLHAPWTGGVFVSYRREDSAPQAGRLYDHLSAHFGAERVFIDVGTLLPGEDFATRIRDTLNAADALLEIIGKRWLEARDDTGRRRIDDSRDFVRMEIATALERGARVIPVLVGGATIPKEEELPSPLAPLARRNAIAVSDARFPEDVKRLIRALEQEPGPENAKPSAQALDGEREDAVG
jgi:hypothetical protein